MIYKYHDFANGLRLVHKQLRGNVAHISVLVKVGSRHETTSQLGMAHFIEHMIFKGTTNRSNYSILSRLENVGADLNAFTTKEDTTIYASIESKYFGRAVELFADIVSNSTFPEKEIEKEKAVILDELNSYRDSPAEWIHDEFDECVYNTHPLGHNILGSKKSIKAINRTKVMDFYRKYYVPDNMVISVIAPFSMQKVVDILQKHFNQPSELLPIIGNGTTPYYAPSQSTKKYSKHQSHAIIGNVTCHAYDSMRTAMALLNNMLGGPAMNSILNVALREKHGIAYNLESNYQAFSDSGLFSIYFGTDELQLAKAFDITLKELDKLKKTKISGSKFSQAIRQLKGQLAVSLQSQQNEMLAMAKNMSVYNKVDSIAEIHQRIDSITSAQLCELANRTFDNNSLSTLIFTNQNTNLNFITRK